MHTFKQEYVCQPHEMVISGSIPPESPFVIHVGNQTTVEYSKAYDHYKKTPAAILAAMQLMLGVFSITLNAAAISAQTSYLNSVAYGIWSPTIWFFAGAFGIASTCKRNSHFIIATMVMSIVSVITITYCLPLACFALADDGHYWNKYHFDFGKFKCTDVVNDRGQSVQECKEEYDVPVRVLNPDWPRKIALDSFLIIIFFIEGTVAILASALCYKTLRQK